MYINIGVISLNGFTICIMKLLKAQKYIYSIN